MIEAWTWVAGSIGGCKSWSETGYILKVELPGFADGCTKERKEPRMTLSFLMWAKKKR